MHFVARPYGLDDVFKGALDKSTTTYLNIPFTRWMEERGITWEDIKGRTDDLQSASIFPKVTSVEDLGILVRWMTSEPQLEEGEQTLAESRESFCRRNLGRRQSQASL